MMPLCGGVDETQYEQIRTEQLPSQSVEASLAVNMTTGASILAVIVAAASL